MTAETIPTAPAASPITGPGLLRRIAGTPSGVFGLVVVGALVLLAVFAPLLAPHDYTKLDVEHRMQGPSATYWLGTDNLGRDLLSRLMLGARIALQIAVPAVAIGVFVGLLLGLAAGYLGGKVDASVVVLLDVIQSFPAVVLALAVLALLGSSTVNIVLVIAVAFVPSFGRVTRASVQSIRRLPFIDAERNLGAGPPRIIGRHVLPNVVAPLVVLTAMNLPSAVAIESGLAFLGLGVQPPTPDWGVVLSDGFGRIRDSPWPVLWACAALAVTTLGFTFLGERLRDVLDVRTVGNRS
ncbi:MAG TPA: ABC transporter permease [Pseudonocardia sp.]|jgi:peptide/nickel transport system permease protein|nr:ABC transporter permease [Pseudonocardia sp.]